MTGDEKINELKYIIGEQKEEITLLKNFGVHTNENSLKVHS
jgi:hypothetical protein